MFRQASSTQIRNRRPEAGDENVRAEAQAEEKNSLQPMGNEAANTELLDQMLKEAN